MLSIKNRIRFQNVQFPILPQGHDWMNCHWTTGIVYQTIQTAEADKGYEITRIDVFLIPLYRCINSPSFEFMTDVLFDKFNVLIYLKFWYSWPKERNIWIAPITKKYHRYKLKSVMYDIVEITTWAQNEETSFLYIAIFVWCYFLNRNRLFVISCYRH